MVVFWCRSSFGIGSTPTWGWTGRRRYRTDETWLPTFRRGRTFLCFCWALELVDLESTSRLPTLWVEVVKFWDVLALNTLTASAILGQTWLPLLIPNPNFQKSKVHLQPKQTVLFPFTRWQHVYYILETRQAALVRRWSSALCCSMRDMSSALTQKGAC